MPQENKERVGAKALELAAELVAGSTLAGQSGEGITHTNSTASPHLSCRGRVLAGRHRAERRGQGSKCTQTATMDMTDDERTGRGSCSRGIQIERNVFCSGLHLPINGAMVQWTLSRLIEFKCLVFLFFNK